MNTVKSVYYGWATFILAGGGAYFFAKRSINADRATKAEAERQKRIRQYEMEYNATHASSTTSGSTSNPVTAKLASDQAAQSNTASGRSNGGPENGNPSVQASQDPAATRHAPEGEEKSKYEASVAYRSRKGGSVLVRSESGVM